jgi:hypothetical protein
MEQMHSESLADSLSRLTHLEKAHLEVSQQMFEAYGGAYYGMDLLAAGALNRSLAHAAGFRTLLQAKNLICAGALLRLQLDTAMRLYAAFLVAQPHDFAVAVLRGERIRDIKDRDGKKMTDAYLAQKLGEEFPWVPRVYERTSGYVHLSSTHLLSTLSMAAEASTNDRRLTIKISAEDKDLPDAIYIEAADAFGAATEIFLRYVHGWVFSKANPELIQKWKNALASEISSQRTADSEESPR